MKFKSVLLGALTVALVGCEAAENNNVLDPQFSGNDNDGQISWISTGQVKILDPFNPIVEAGYHYHAKLDKNGTKGKFSYTTKLNTGDLVASGEVICMDVQELPNGVRRAKFGGVITSSNRPEFPAGSGFVWNVTDDIENNEASDVAESASPLLGFSAAALELHCRLGGFFPESPVDGHVHLHKTGNGS